MIVRYKLTGKQESGRVVVAGDEIDCLMLTSSLVASGERRCDLTVGLGPALAGSDAAQRQPAGRVGLVRYDSVTKPFVLLPASICRKQTHVFDSIMEM